MKKKPASSLFHRSWLLVLLVVIISLLGLLFVFEASVAEAFQQFGDQYHFVRQHAQWLAVGFVGMIVGSFLPMPFWRKTAPVFYWLGVLSLVLVLIPGVGVSVNGAQRWLAIGGFRFQAVEIMKFGLVVYFAEWLTRHQGFKSFLLLTAIPTGLLLLQPDLGSTLLLTGIAGSMYFIAGGDLKKLTYLSLAGVLGVIGLIVSQPYRLRRVTTFLNPELDPLGASFHIRQITIALGNGGWFGQGIGKSRQKFNYIPEASNDSIFAIVAEEIGFIGSLFIIGLYALFFAIGLSLVSQIKDQFAYLVSVGILSWIGLQLVLNLAAVVALVPLTGMPLPFFSYGGTSLVMLLCGTGVLISATRTQT